MPSRRSLRLDTKHADAAFQAGWTWYMAATEVWEAEAHNPHPAMPDSVLKLEAVFKAAEARCSKAAKVLLAYDVFDQPLPGDLEERRPYLTTEEMLEELYQLV